MPDTVDRISLSGLPNLQPLFEKLNAGAHLNRHHDLELWVDLETHLEAYKGLFGALGYDLQHDDRGFAWFQPREATSTVSKGSRLLALFFLMLFEHQADQGLNLGKFHSWVIDEALLELLFEHNCPLLEAESIFSAADLGAALKPGVTYGILAESSRGWALLPAVHRYLDHFRTLAAVTRERQQQDSALIAQEAFD